MSDEEKVKVVCKYGKDCYQKNPLHLAKYSHPKSNVKSELEVSAMAKNDENLETSGRDHGGSLSAEPSSSPQAPKRSPRERKKFETEHKKQKATEDSKDADAAAARNFAGEMDITQEYNEVLSNLEGKNYFEIFQRRVRYSQKAEYEDLLKSPEIFIRNMFLVEMPDDFYKFWDFCKSISKGENKPQDVFVKIGLGLVGPFDYLARRFDDAKILEPGEYLRHWRFFYDPPEFQTIFVKSNTGIHYGYWRDDPKEKTNLLMARNDSNKGCEFEFVGGNCFETALYFLEKNVDINPFNKTLISSFKKSINEFAASNGVDLDSLSKLQKQRNKNVVTKTFHRAGLVVPFDRKTQTGYRPLLETDSNIKKILMKLDNEVTDELLSKVMEDLQVLITAASIAADECDFGTSVELGIDLFCSGHTEFHDVISSLFINGYSLLHRPQFIAIMKAHMANRRTEVNLSCLEENE